MGDQVVLIVLALKAILDPGKGMKLCELHSNHFADASERFLVIMEAGSWHGSQSQ